MKLTSIIPAEEIYEDSSGRKGIGETPQCVARGGSPAALRSAKYISGAVITHHSSSLALYINCESLKSNKTYEKSFFLKNGRNL
ncbi:hypothetical protein CIT14_11710 [Virgibacillus profundi]|nr:hypothetical protein CIT14_11710 [Virgibacillus profundi]